ncbi:transposable element Tcb2 transposase [Trichonephila clavipes]|nr:transposable element Tcb2 transposase [Trichonephila clavipes]
MPLCCFRSQYEQLLQFERGRIIDMMEAGWSARRVARQLGHSGYVVRRCWDQWIREMSFTQRSGSMSFTRRSGSGHPRQTSRREDRHIVRNARHHWLPSRHRDESRFNLSSDDNCVRVWRPRRERLNPAFVLQRNTAPAAGIMVWGAIVYNTGQPLVLISGTMTAQWSHFQQNNAQPHTAKVSQDCLPTVTNLPWPARSPDLSPIEHIWDHLGWRVWHPTSLNELKARLQQIWSEMSQDII